MSNWETITYTPAETEDIPAVFALAKELIDRYEDISAIPYEKVLRWMLNKITENIASYRCIILEGKKVGYFHLDMAKEEAELDDLYILPEYQGRGIGTAVIGHCLRQADKPVFLYVFRKNTGAIRLYKRMGFSVAETVGNTRMIMRHEG